MHDHLNARTKSRWLFICDFIFLMGLFLKTSALSIYFCMQDCEAISFIFPLPCADDVISDSATFWLTYAVMLHWIKCSPTSCSRPLSVWPMYCSLQLEQVNWQTTLDAVEQVRRSFTCIELKGCEVNVANCLSGMPFIISVVSLTWLTTRYKLVTTHLRKTGRQQMTVFIVAQNDDNLSNETSNIYTSLIEK